MAADWGTVREIASAFPGTEELTSRDQPSFRVRVLVHLEAISRRELADRIEDAWALRAPKRLLAERTESA